MNLEGGCACKSIRYRLTASPLIVHACHCRDCQRLTGGPFVINVWIEGKFVEPGPVAPKSFRLAGGTGKHHDVFFCEACGTTLWSRYHIVPGDCLFVRAGTLDTPEAVRPDVLPVDDYGVRKGFAIAFDRSELPSPKELAAYGDRWKPYRTAASWYLWRAVQQATARKAMPLSPAEEEP